MGDKTMKRYYRNWYQHYLGLEAEKEREIQRGYYSNLAPKTQKNADVKVHEKQTVVSTDAPIQAVGKRKETKQKFRLVDLFFPFVTICAFVTLWYQLGVEPIRHFVNEGLVFTGIREETVDVISYHVSLLNQHMEFADAVSNFMTGEHELSFADLDLLYNEIRLHHQKVIEVSAPIHVEVVRLWDFKIANIRQMMDWLQSDDNITEQHAQFLNDQSAIAAMIRTELQILD